MSRLLLNFVRLGTTINYIAVGKELLGFVWVYELARTELYGSDNFEKQKAVFDKRRLQTIQHVRNSRGRRGVNDQNLSLGSH